jgi:hypothetical protein
MSDSTKPPSGLPGGQPRPIGPATQTTKAPNTGPPNS